MGKLANNLSKNTEHHFLSAETYILPTGSSAFEVSEEKCQYYLVLFFWQVAIGLIK